MDQERISESINKFYEYNHIDPDQYTADMMEAYTKNKACDARIARDKLREKVEVWIRGFQEADRKYFLKLLENYKYFSERELTYRFALLCKYIFDELEISGVEKHEVLFVTVPSAGGVAGGGDFIRSYLIKVNLEWGIDKNQIISDISKMGEKTLEGRKAIIFIDDIVGTGFSVRKIIVQFLKHFPGINKERYLWGMAGIMVMKSAVRYIKNKVKALGIDLALYVQPENYIRSCMTGNYIFGESEVKQIEEVIKEYEKSIGSDKKTGEDFVMGFRACKLLLSFYYNTPNNTLCTFWKYTEQNNPVFPRDRHIRPTIEMLKKKKAHNRENAYLKGCADRENV